MSSAISEATDEKPQVHNAIFYQDLQCLQKQKQAS